MMNSPHHHMPDLFDQLGLDSDEKAMRHFIRSHRPIPADSRLADAPFWNDAQAAFLREQLRADSDWTMLIDSLSASLREHPDPAELPQADEDNSADDTPRAGAKQAQGSTERTQRTQRTGSSPKPAQHA